MAIIKGLGFARIRDDRGRYALVVHSELLQRRRSRILSPIGGDVTLTGNGKHLLRSSFGATKIQQGDILGCHVPDDRVDALVKWFNDGMWRAISIHMSLHDALVTETGVLSAADITPGSLSAQFARSIRHDRTAPTEKEPVVYIINIFDVRLDPSTLTKLVRASTEPAPGRKLYFVWEQEIQARSTAGEDVAIARICQLLL